jgi:hypothetical protein
VLRVKQFVIKSAQRLQLLTKLRRTEETFIHSFIPLPCAECGDSLPFSGAFPILPYRTFPSHSSLPTILPSSLTSSCHLFLGLPLGLVASNFILNTPLGILFSSILCTCPNQHNLCTLIVSIIVGFFNHCINFLLLKQP